MNNQQLVEKAIRKAKKNKDVKFLCKIYFGDDISPLQAYVIRIIAFHAELNIWRLSLSCMTRWGKSYCIARGVSLYFMMNKDKNVYFLGPKEEQARILRDYMTELVFKCPTLLKLSDLNKTGGLDAAKKEASRKRVTFSKSNNEYRVFSADGDANRLMGHGIGSGGGIIVRDEAVLINDGANAKINRMAGDNPDKTMIIDSYNPWHRDNFAYEHSIDPTWEHVHIGWREAIKDGRTTKAFVDEQRKELTEIEFDVLYESKFPKESEDQLIPYWSIQKAIRKIPKNLEHSDDARLGADIAEMGKDLTVLTIGVKNKGLYIVEEIKWHGKKELMETVGKIVQIEENEKDYIPLKKMTIDAVGMGSGVAGRLEELRRENKVSAKIVRFIAGASPKSKKDKERFINLKAQAGLHLRKLFIEGRIIIPPELAKACPILIKELGKMKKKIQSDRKYRILDPGEAQNDSSMKKSPDFYDSLCMFCWDEENTGKLRFIGDPIDNKIMKIEKGINKYA